MKRIYENKNTLKKSDIIQGLFFKPIVGFFLLGSF